MPFPRAKLRWEDTFVEKGDDFKAFWRSYLEGGRRNLLFIVGRGFDPRMCSCLEEIVAAGGQGTRDCTLIRFDEGPDSPSKKHADAADANEGKLRGLLADNRVSERRVPMLSINDQRITSQQATFVFGSIEEFRDYSDVVVDLSAMPRSVGFPIINKLLTLIHEEQRRGNPAPNLHAVVAENSWLDGLIVDVGVDESPTYMHGFRADINLVSAADSKQLWIPLLGENQATQLQRIYAKVSPDEICPVVPSPSARPRRGDDIIRSYSQLLFDTFGVEPKNILHVAEDNPLEAYARIFRIVEYYQYTLGPLGGCRAILSAHTSKLLSMAALLAAYELKDLRACQAVGIAHVESRGSEMADVSQVHPHELYTTWLAGDPYAHK